MAQIFYSITKCPICGKVLNERDVVIAFPPFVPNIKDQLYLFSDQGCHKNCVNNHPLGSVAIKLSNEFLFETRPDNRICKISGSVISIPDFYFFTGLLTSDQNEPLYRYNFITMDRRSIKLWDKREDLLRELISFKESGKWKDLYGTGYIDKIIDDLKMMGNEVAP